MGEVGTEARIAYDLDGGDCPVEGDLLATPAGSGYEVVEVRRSPTRDRAYLKTIRLGRGACSIDDPEVFPLYWNRR